MTIKTTRIKSVQAPRVDTLDLSNQLDGKSQTFTLPRKIHAYDRHYLVWNSTVYRNDANHRFYSVSKDGMSITTYFKYAPHAGHGHTLQLAVDMSGDGDDNTITKAEFEEAVDNLNESINNEATAREEADAALKEELEQEIEAEATTRQERDGELQSQIDAIVNSTDVKDVVGTKAELDAYDTTQLGDNDIIKVLADESSDGATTYYRYNAAEKKFDPIGSVGPYYTKAEADEKMAEAVEENVPEKLKNVPDKVLIPSTSGTGLGINRHSDDNVLQVHFKNLETGSTSYDNCTLRVADDTYAGLMSAADKRSLDELVEGGGGGGASSEDFYTTDFHNTWGGDFYYPVSVAGDNEVAFKANEFSYNSIPDERFSTAVAGQGNNVLAYWRDDMMSFGSDAAYGIGVFGTNNKLFGYGLIVGDNNEMGHPENPDRTGLYHMLGDICIGNGNTTGNNGLGGSNILLGCNGLKGLAGDGLYIGCNNYAYYAPSNIAIGPKFNFTGDGVRPLMSGIKIGGFTLTTENANKNSIAIGAVGTGDNGISIGGAANHNYSVSFGKTTARQDEFMVASGKWENNERYVAGVKAGEEDTDAVNMAQLKALIARVEELEAKLGSA